MYLCDLYIKLMYFSLSFIFVIIFSLLIYQEFFNVIKIVVIKSSLLIRIVDM